MTRMTSLVLLVPVGIVGEIEAIRRAAGKREAVGDGERAGRADAVAGREAAAGRIP